jgi:hypothetical protein
MSDVSAAQVCNGDAPLNDGKVLKQSGYLQGFPTE